LTRLPGDRVLFAFTESYVADENRPTLSLSFKDALGSLIIDVRPTQTRLPVFFANLLPEGTMRDYLAALIPLLRGEQVSVESTGWKAIGQVNVPGATPPPVLIAALAPRRSCWPWSIALPTATKSWLNTAIPAARSAIVASGKNVFAFIVTSIAFAVCGEDATAFLRQD